MRTPALIVICSLSLSLLLGPAPADAALYRWTDDAGNEGFTDDLSRVPDRFRDRCASVDPSAPANMGEGPRSPSGSIVGTGAVRDRSGRGEAWWRSRARKARAELSGLEAEYDLVLREERSLSGAPAGRGAKERAVARKKAKLEQKIAQARQRVESGLPDEARRAGALPGWLRE